LRGHGGIVVNGAANPASGHTAGRVVEYVQYVFFQFVYQFFGNGDAVIGGQLKLIAIEFLLIVTGAALRATRGSGRSRYPVGRADASQLGLVYGQAEREALRQWSGECYLKHDARRVGAFAERQEFRVYPGRTDAVFQCAVVEVVRSRQQADPLRL
jgi:hypothetical protein